MTTQTTTRAAAACRHSRHTTQTSTRERAPAEHIRPGDVILPPARELSLWMRRDAKERGLSEAALNITVTDVREGRGDTGGRWIIIEANYSDEWYGDRIGRHPIIFKVRPETRWPVVSRANREAVS